ncbi:CBS domain-containing protein [Fredinandcohnia onubensis]|uniref:CBS domain-containing protein n=1 Tax=Fredinandcohnia onubensis TaxID=1571209 RepID=UPI000C0BFAF3|nr:CBS domain-containing protein [Fredinandcohnia onubensis]
METVEIDLSKRFEIAFNRVHKALSKMVKNVNGDIFSQLVAHGAKRHAIIRSYKDELFQFAKLRNAIVHEKLRADFYIAEPHQEVVERIEEIAALLEKPVTALSISSRPVIYFNFHSSIKDVILAIHNNSYTKFPIYKDGTCIGILTSGAIMKWMAKQLSNDSIDLSNIRVGEVIPYETKHLIEIVDQNCDIFAVEEKFEKRHAHGKKLEAVIITETGQIDEKPLGIITSWDLIEID